MTEYIDEEEREIIESLHSEEWVSDFNEDIKKQYEEYARNYFEFKNKVEVRLTDKDFNRIQIKSAQLGIPYESIIALLIHKYNEGEIALTI